MTTSYLFAYYTLDSQVSFSSSISITDFLLYHYSNFSGIINYDFVMQNWKKKKKQLGENKDKFRKMYPNNHETF